MATQLKKVVAPSGGDYTSLEACMNANEQNLVTADNYFDVEISGSWSSADTTAVTIHNYTTDATRYINIYTTGDARHAGVYSTSKYSLEVNSYLNAPMNSGVEYTTIDGLQIRYGNSTVCVNIYHNSTIKNCIVFSASSVGIYARDSTNVTVYNNIVYGNGTNGFFGDPDGYKNFTIYNNTFYGNGGVGVQCNDNYNRGTVKIRNNLSIGNGGDYSVSASNTEEWSNNGSGDTSGNAGLQNLVAADEFVDPTGTPPDFHLKSGADSIDAGADLSGTFTTDIDGTTRSGTWDIGADEYVAPASSAAGFMTCNAGYWGP